MTIRWLALVVAGGLAAAARPSSATAAWRQPVGGASPIDDAGDAFDQRVAALGGVPFVAWPESDGINTEVRVSRLNAAGTAWEEVVGGASPIHHASDRSAFAPSLTAVGGVPYVAWREDDGTKNEVRVSRLEPELASQGAVADATDATLRAIVHTYGLAYPIGSDYGPALASQTAAKASPTGSDNLTISTTVRRLSPSTGYAFRPFATAGVPAQAADRAESQGLQDRCARPHGRRTEPAQGGAQAAAAHAHAVAAPYRPRLRPAGQTRTVRKTVQPKLMRQRVATRGARSDDR
jgi:hypothetical protein